MNFRKIGIYVIFIIAFSAVSSFSQPELVKVKLSKSNITSAVGGSFEVRIIADIKDGFHINSNKPKEDFLIPMVVSSGNKLFPIAKVSYPTPKEELLKVSPVPVSIYSGEISVALNFVVGKNVSPGDYVIPIEFNFQACDDETCFPPDVIKTNLNLKIEKGNGEAVTSPLETSATSENSATSGTIPQDSDSLNVSGTDGTTVPATVSDTTTNVPAMESDADQSILLAILFAFIGGIILNLMPCVLPVLSLKIMGFIKQAGEERSKLRKHGLAFTFGVLISFWALAGLLLILRAGGEYLGWGFQLQSPSFVIVLSVLLFLFGLSLFGVFEIGVTLTAVGQNAPKGSTYTGSFFSGILATIVATPCTAPFMGSALGFALSQPAYVSMLIFTALGLGMALPYVLLTSIPALLKFVPKPGAWMETFKQFMGFLMVATVLWLIWVLSLQTGAEGVLILLGSLLLVSLSGWIYGRWSVLHKPLATRRIAQVISGLILIGALALSITYIKPISASTDAVHSQGLIEWRTFSPELVAQLRSQNKPVFIDFTAAWCLSCQVNEKVAFGSEEVQKAFADKGIIALKADWTNKDEVIAKELAKFGRNSVPLYVLYLPEKEAVLLPEILTPDIVLSYLKDLK
ncbi:MAG: thioredoxin family protein [Melioribacteraceae bacterium]|nr:thioredoxin family protein [Melioribacteraceae bacterium]